MAFYIYVVRKKDNVYVYDKPLGSSKSVYLRWYVPAHRLGLRLVKLIGAVYDYDNAFEATGAELDELRHELTMLEAFWDKKFIRSGPISYRTVDIDMVWLREESDQRIGYLREAIKIAKECDGILRIF